MWGGLVMNEVKPGNGKHRPMRPVALARLSVAIAGCMVFLYGPASAHAQQAPAPAPTDTASQDTSPSDAAPGHKDKDKKKDDKSTTELGAVTVTGVRASLASAQSIN